MKTMKTKIAIIGTLIAAASAAACGQTTGWQPAPGHTQTAIWPGRPPDSLMMAGPETVMTDDQTLVGGKPWIFEGRVSEPTMTVYPPKRKNTGAAMVVFPGGGYQILAMDLEGTEICDWMNSKGITCVLLKYRVPGQRRKPKSGAYPDSPAALEDAQRTMGLVRFHAAEWGVDPHKIGVIGFSAGGHLVAAVSTNYKRRLYPAVDAADKVSCRPDFAVALYPGHLREHTKREGELNPYVPVTKETPPTILIQATDDPIDPVENSLVYYAALKNAGVEVEMHLYAHGGHAFGLRRSKEPITDWPRLVEIWLAAMGVTPRE